MKVLGIDPSYTATGFAITQQQGNKQELLHCGTISLPSHYELSSRIGIFYECFNTMVQEYSITKISLETPFLGKNVQTFLKLGYLRGIIHLIAHQHLIQVIEFSPKEVKLAVTGFGSAEKDQVSRMVHMLFPGLIQKKSLDITDAIAISLCGLWKQ